ncbi:MAG: tetratricopeptide repeat-containing sulfotransferase family protein [Woeseiaceae bacterium]
MKSRLEEADTQMREGHFPSAHFALKKVLRREPNNINALVLDATLRLRTGKRTESADIVDRLFGLKPETFDCELQKQLGHTCFQNDLNAKAVQLFEWVRQENEQDELTLYHSGVCLRRLGRMDDAEQRLLECVEAGSDVAAPNLQLGHVYKAIGDTARAADYYKKFIALSRSAKGTGYWCLANLKSYAFSDDETVAMRQELESGQQKLPQQSALHFALGWAAEKDENYRAALEHYNLGNSIQANLSPFNAKQYARIVSEVQSVGGEEKPVTIEAKPVAILIVGLPRSGTTLIEQVLSAHSKVQATDELPFLESMALRLELDGGYLNRLSAMTEEESASLRQQYLDGAGVYLKEKSDFFIDKYPGNFLHVGLIKRIMPEAIVIDARRDPRDVAISAYRQLFNVRNEFAASFNGIYEYYKGYLATIEHWKSAYPGQVKTLNYEQLVTSPDEEIRGLLDFCGLEFEPECLEFYRQKRTVLTPSANQVSKPMYTSSVGHWRQFEEFASDEMSRLGSLLSTD